MHPLALLEGRNCWRVAPADRLALIVDGGPYFRALRVALLEAREMALMVGWDFDFEIEMLPGESDAEGLAPDGFPNRVGPFLEALVARRESLDIYLLKWSGGAMIAPGRILPSLRLNLFSPEQIHLAFDGHHPIGACHHQKIVVIDDSLAFCGGIDVTEGRWDTPGHLPGDTRRTLRGGDIAQPWHDAAAVLSGPAAEALGALARARWRRARGEDLPEALAPRAGLWPDGVDPDFRDIPVAVARTEPPTREAPLVAEIERLLLDAIAAAESCIYMESQYFSAGSIVRALAARLGRRDGPEVVVINPDAAQGLVEDAAMHSRRDRLIRDLQALDRHGRFRILHPVDAAGAPIYVHAKLLIVDDRLLKVGSSNLDRRSMGFDTEADVAIVAATPADRARIAAIRAALLAEHLGVAPAAVAAELDRHGSLIAAIDALNRPVGRGLRPIEPRERSFLASLIADSLVFDPRFRQSARNRLGLTGRHLARGLAGLAIAGVAAVVIRRRGGRDPAAAAPEAEG